MSEEIADSHERAVILKFEVLLMLGALILFLLVAGFGFWLLEREQSARIREQETVRQENVRGLQILLINQCREIEELKGDIRSVSRQIGLQRELIRQFASKPGGCGAYPDPIRPP